MLMRSTCFALLSAPFLVFAQNEFKIPSTFSAAAGQPFQLSWDPTTDGTVTLVLRYGASSDLAKGMIIKSNIQNSGSYTWDVPSSINYGEDYTVEIVDDSDPSQVNYTPFFTIDSDNTGSPSSALSSVSVAVVTSALPTSTASPSGTQTDASSTATTTETDTTLVAPSMTTGMSSTDSTQTSSTTTDGSAASASDAATSVVDSQSTGGAPRATAVAGLLGAVALGAYAL